MCGFFVREKKLKFDNFVISSGNFSALKAFFKWVMTDEAQSEAVAFGLVPLPIEVRMLNLDAINSIRVSSEDLVSKYLAMQREPQTVIVHSNNATNSATSSTQRQSMTTMMIVAVGAMLGGGGGGGNMQQMPRLLIVVLLVVVALTGSVSAQANSTDNTVADSTASIATTVAIVETTAATVAAETTAPVTEVYTRFLFYTK